MSSVQLPPRHGSSITLFSSTSPAALALTSPLLVCPHAVCRSPSALGAECKRQYPNHFHKGVVRRALHKLVSAGKVIKVGSGNNTFVMLGNPQGQPLASSPWRRSALVSRSRMMSWY